MKEQQVESISVAEVERETCNECFCWLPVKNGHKCIVSGKKRLGSMFACQFIESRRAFVLTLAAAGTE